MGKVFNEAKLVFWRNSKYDAEYTFKDGLAVEVTVEFAQSLRKKDLITFLACGELTDELDTIITKDNIPNFWLDSVENYKNIERRKYLCLNRELIFVNGFLPESKEEKIDVRILRIHLEFVDFA